MKSCGVNDSDVRFAGGGNILNVKASCGKNPSLFETAENVLALGRVTVSIMRGSTCGLLTTTKFYAMDTHFVAFVFAAKTLPNRRACENLRLSTHTMTVDDGLSHRFAFFYHERIPVYTAWQCWLYLISFPRRIAYLVAARSTYSTYRLVWHQSRRSDTIEARPFEDTTHGVLRGHVSG